VAGLLVRREEHTRVQTVPYGDERCFPFIHLLDWTLYIPIEHRLSKIASTFQLSISSEISEEGRSFNVMRLVDDSPGPT